jgi:RNA recognition motif. (a.k.a. RRM, RBD, or RNP domain)
MSTQYPRWPGRRSGRGPRGRGNRDNDRQPRDSRDSRDARNATPAEPEKKSLWQKIFAFFGGAKNGADSNGSSRPQGRSVATTTSRYPNGAAAAPTATAPAPVRTARKPEAIEVTSPKLYVGNLSFDAAESDLLDLFKGVGAVQLAEIVTHAHTQKSKGFGFVTMASIDEAKRAVEVLHDQDFMGRKLVVSGAKTPPDRR